MKVANKDIKRTTKKLPAKKSRKLSAIEAQLYSAADDIGALKRPDCSARVMAALMDIRAAIVRLIVTMDREQRGV